MYVYLSYFLSIISYDNNIKKYTRGLSTVKVSSYFLLKVNINYNIIKN